MGIIANVPLALSPSSHWHLHHHFSDAVAVVVLPLLLHWRRLPRHTYVATTITHASSPSLRWRFPCHTGVAASIALASLLVFYWRQHPGGAGIYTIVLRELLPLLSLLHWHCCPRRTRVSPALRGCLCRRSAGVIALIAPVLPPPSHGRLHRRSAGVNTHIALAYKP